MADKVCQNVLIIHDQPAPTRALLEALANLGVRGVVVPSMGEARQRLQDQDWELLWAAHGLAREDGFELLRHVKQDNPERPVIVSGPDNSAAPAVEVMRLGCDDYLIEPLEVPALQSLLCSLLPNHPVPLAASDQESMRCLYRIAGVSKSLAETIRLARKVAPTSMPVLISGESGTGKELVSYLIHRSSNRRARPYIKVNCAALSETLLESELFGHERGAFTGAVAQRKGRFELAHGGTLLLDEISETGPRLQAELLRVLEQQDFERVGGTESVQVNVRVLATTNRNLAQEVEAGRFRRDLYYRISGVHLGVPPLRRRPDDIPVLVWHFVNTYAREVRRRIARLDERMMQIFCHYSWPGNVRQLRNVVRTALVLGSGGTLSLEDAPHLLEELMGQPNPTPTAPGPGNLSLQELERQAILEALRRTNSHQAKAAQLLGITDRTLREKLRRYRSEGVADMQKTGEGQWVSETA